MRGVIMTRADCRQALRHLWQGHSSKRARWRIGTLAKEVIHTPRKPNMTSLVQSSENETQNVALAAWALAVLSVDTSHPSSNHQCATSRWSASIRARTRHTLDSPNGLIVNRGQNACWLFMPRPTPTRRRCSSRIAACSRRKLVLWFPFRRPILQ